jgi:hypothetical protein
MLPLSTGQLRAFHRTTVPQPNHHELSPPIPAFRSRKAFNAATFLIAGQRGAYWNRKVLSLPFYVSADREDRPWLAQPLEMLL